jgi:hypothetical protein
VPLQCCDSLGHEEAGCKRSQVAVDGAILTREIQAHEWPMNLPYQIPDAGGAFAWDCLEANSIAEALCRQGSLHLGGWDIAHFHDFQSTFWLLLRAEGSQQRNTSASSKKSNFVLLRTRIDAEANVCVGMTVLAHVRFRDSKFIPNSLWPQCIFCLSLGIPWLNPL